MWWNGSALPPTVQGVLMPLLPLNSEPSSLPFVLLLAPNLLAHLLVLPLALVAAPHLPSAMAQRGSREEKAKNLCAQDGDRIERCLAGILGTNPGQSN